MSSNIAKGRKTNYLILGKITLFILIFQINSGNYGQLISMLQHTEVIRCNTKYLNLKKT